MTKKPSEEFEYLSNNPDYIPDPEIEELMEEEILRAPKTRNSWPIDCATTRPHHLGMLEGIWMRTGKT